MERRETERQTGIRGARAHTHTHTGGGRQADKRMERQTERHTDRLRGTQTD